MTLSRVSLSRVSLSSMSLSRVSLSRVSPSRVLLYIELQTNDHEGTSHFTYHIQTVAFFLKVKRNTMYIWFDNKTNFITWTKLFTEERATELYMLNWSKFKF